MKSNNWILVDNDSQQHVRANSDTEFELIEMGLINPETETYEVYSDTIDISDYSDPSMKEELITILNGFGYSGIEEVRTHYGDEANQVMTECVFEYYGSFQANVKFTGSENECIKYIQEYICL